jgi:endonuclease/exonuclease/phosphatase family metal-dependent hydrolase
LSFNIRHGGVGREAAIAAVIRASNADLVVLQEARRADAIARIAAAAGMPHFSTRAGMSVGFVSRVAIAHHAWHKPRVSQHAFLEIVPDQAPFRIFGIHLSAIHAAWTEQRRLFELNAMLNGIAEHQHGPHVLIGDFNTLAPGETLDVGVLPQRLQLLVWLSGGRIRWRVIQTVLDRGYVDVFRLHHPDADGLTFPSWGPHVRLDYAFVPAAFTAAAHACEVIAAPETQKASDHLPLAIDLNFSVSRTT